MDHNSMWFLSCSLQLFVTGLFLSHLGCDFCFQQLLFQKKKKKKAEIFTYWYLFQNTELWLKNKNQ